MFSKPSVKTASLLILLICLLFSLVATSAAQTTPTAAPEPDTRVVSTGEYVVLRSDDWVSSAKPVLPPPISMPATRIQPPPPRSSSITSMPPQPGI